MSCVNMLASWGKSPLVVTWASKAKNCASMPLIVVNPNLCDQHWIRQRTWKEKQGAKTAGLKTRRKSIRAPKKMKPHRTPRQLVRVTESRTKGPLTLKKPILFVLIRFVYSSFFLSCCTCQHSCTASRPAEENARATPQKQNLATHIFSYDYLRLSHFSAPFARLLAGPSYASLSALVTLAL